MLKKKDIHNFDTLNTKKLAENVKKTIQTMYLSIATNCGDEESYNKFKNEIEKI